MNTQKNSIDKKKAGKAKAKSLKMKTSVKAGGYDLKTQTGS
jgi:hypothetical protein